MKGGGGGCTPSVLAFRQYKIKAVFEGPRLCIILNMAFWNHQHFILLTSEAVNRTSDVFKVGLQAPSTFYFYKPMGYPRAVVSLPFQIVHSKRSSTQLFLFRSGITSGDVFKRSPNRFWIGYGSVLSTLGILKSSSPQTGRHSHTNYIPGRSEITETHGW